MDGINVVSDESVRLVWAAVEVVRGLLTDGRDLSDWDEDALFNTIVDTANQKIT